MKARHADFGRAAPRPLLVAAAALAPPALFLAWYVAAASRGLLGGREAAAAGVAAETALTAVVLAAQAHAEQKGAPRAVLLAQWLAPTLIVEIWMAFDLLRSGSAVGVWAAVPAMMAVSGLLWELVGSANGDTSKDDPVSSFAQRAANAGTPSSDPTGAVAVPSASGVASTALEEPPIASVDRGRGAGAAVVGVHAGFWKNLVRELSGVGGRLPAEQGGVAFTTSWRGLTTVIGVVLPKQTSATPVHCEFSVLDVERVRDALDTLGPRLSDRIRLTWLHTHPGLSVFLSATDLRTTSTWRSLDPAFRPIVVDVSKPALDDQIGVFDETNRPVRPVGLVEHGIEPADSRALRDAVLARYRRECLEPPRVLVGRIG